MTLEDADTITRSTLTSVLHVAERYGITVAIEPHQSITHTTAGLLRVATLVDSRWLKVNYDTGNAYLGGEDPYQGLQVVSHMLAHVHAKDISIQHSEAERGKTTGTPV